MRFIHAPAVLLAALAMGGAAAPSAAARPDTVDGDAKGQQPSFADRATLDQDLEAIHNAGISGVLGEIRGKRERLVAQAGVAELGSPRPVSRRAHFRMGSATKTFVAAVVLQLVGEGELALEDSVETWLPGVVTGNGNDGRAITVRDLLQQTSGLFDYLRDSPPSAEAFERDRFRTYQPEELLATALRHPPNFAPGARWEYSNTNYIVAGMIIERVTGHTWEREVRDRILRPLGLRHTFSPGASPFVPHPRAAAYQQFEPGGALIDVTTRNETWGDAAGNMITTTADLGRFWLALANGEVLRPAELAEMRETVPAEGFPVPGARYGLGVVWLPLSCGGGYWSHGGDTHGYTTRAGVSSDGVRSVAISMTTRLLELAPLELADAAVDGALCGHR